MCLHVAYTSYFKKGYVYLNYQTFLSKKKKHLYINIKHIQEKNWRFGIKRHTIKIDLEVIFNSKAL